MRQLWAPWRMVYVGGTESPAAEGCFLCHASSDDGAAHVVESAELTVSLLNRYPYNSGHLMVVPRRHAADLVDLTGEEGTAVFAAVQRALRALRRALAPDGFNVGLNSGIAAGASVEHVHLHVVPRWQGDTNFMPVVGDIKVLPQHLEETAAALRDAFTALGAEEGA